MIQKQNIIAKQNNKNNSIDKNMDLINKLTKLDEIINQYFEKINKLNVVPTKINEIIYNLRTKQKRELKSKKEEIEL